MRIKPEERPAAKKKILDVLRSGSTVEAACAFARIHRDTWYAWMKKDPKLKSDYEEAVAASEVSLVLHIKKDPSWQSKAWLLERRNPAQWGAIARTEVSLAASTTQTIDEWIAKVLDNKG